MAAAATSPFRLLLLLLFLASLHSHTTASIERCPRQEEAPLAVAVGIMQASWCPVSIERSPAVEEVNGQVLEKQLDHSKSDYYCILFYATKCPFSMRMRPIFDDVSSMFPQITHLAIEASSVTPTVLSKYGIRSSPSVLIANRTKVVRYTGSKELASLVYFYREVTGLEPVACLAPQKASMPENASPVKPWNSSIIDAVKNEPYLAFSLLFLSLRFFVFLFPKFFSFITEFWVSYSQHFNLGIIAKSSQLLDCVPQVMDVRKIWSKIKLMIGARNAKVLASSLTSVSLRRPISQRATSMD